METTPFKFIRVIVALAILAVSVHVPRPAYAGLVTFPVDQGPEVDCFWTQEDIDTALDIHTDHFYGEFHDWLPITSHICKRWWSINAAEGSPNEWMNPPNAYWPLWDVEITGDNKYWGFSQPTLQAWMYDTWRVDAVKISRVYQSMTALSYNQSLIVEVSVYFWGPELPGDELWVVFNAPDAVTVRDPKQNMPPTEWNYTYYTGTPIDPME